MTTLPIRTRDTEHWNDIVDLLFINGLLNNNELCQIWYDTTSKEKQDEYFK